MEETKAQNRLFKEVYWKTEVLFFVVLVFNAEKESMLKHAEIYFQGFNFGYLSTAFSFIIIIWFFWTLEENCCS